MLEYFYGSCHFRNVIMGVKHEFYFFFNFKSAFDKTFSSVDYVFFKNRFDIAPMVSRKKEVKRAQHPKRYIFFIFQNRLSIFLEFFYRRERTDLLQLLLFQRYQGTNAQNLQYFTWHTCTAVSPYVHLASASLFTNCKISQ